MKISPEGVYPVAIDPQVRQFLDQKGIELVRARFTKETAVTGDTDEANEKEIPFGNQNIRVAI